MPSGVTTQTALSLINGVGVIYADVGVTSTILAATSGPPAVTVDEALRNAFDEIDGVTNPVAEGDVFDKKNIIVECALVDINERTLAAAEPGATAVTATGVTTLTPKETAAFLASADYLKNFRVVWKVGPDGLLTLSIPKALGRLTRLGADNRSIGKLGLRVEGRVDMSQVGATTDSPTYEWILDAATVPTP